MSRNAQVQVHAKGWIVVTVAALSCLTVSMAAPLEGPGIETSSGQALYKLPRDHALHGGDFYYTSDYMEWYYFTGFFKDADTGEDLSIFLSNFFNAYSGKLGRPVMWTQFATLDFPTGDFVENRLIYAGPLVTNGSDPAIRGFSFTQSVDDGDQGFHVGYEHDTETWTGTLYKAGELELSLAGTVYSPGYIPATPYGVEQQGVSNNNGAWNPETMAGLSYYYLAPNMRITGDMTVGNRTRSVDGVAWFEHQWGNYRSNASDNTHYAWGYARFDNGDMLTIRQWARPGFDFDPSGNRFIYLRKLEGGGYATEYAFGPVAQFVPTNNYSTPDGKMLPVYGTLETPQGTWYVVPDYTDQFSPTPTGLLWEGATFLRAGSPEGPKVAKMFLELVDMANRSDIPDGLPPTDIARPLTGALPEVPPLP